MTEKRPITVGMGEVLWDMLPQGKQLGGAPFNFTRHCAQLGLDAFPVSQIGLDDLGDKSIHLLKTWGMNTRYVSRDSVHPTGVVQVALDDEGKPAYEIREEAAWDYMSLSKELEALAPKVDVICFGSLAQRNEQSRSAIYGFLDRMRPDALKLFDVNLRQSFYSIKSIEESLQRATVLKLSDEELEVLSELFSLNGSIQEMLVELKYRFELKFIAYTRGAEGSLLLDETDIDNHAGNAIGRGDTVGAGDSFSATLCAGLLAGLPLAQLNENANKVAAYVCSQRGATPKLPDDLIKSVSKIFQPSKKH